MRSFILSLSLAVAVLGGGVVAAPAAAQPPPTGREGVTRPAAPAPNAAPVKPESKEADPSGGQSAAPS
jgi:hypothetical protein